MNVVYATIADDADAWVDRVKVRRELDTALLPPKPIDLDHWGEGPSAEAGINALLTFGQP